MKQHYEKFVGKVCTILTQAVSLPLRDPKQHAEYFTGFVTEVNQYGVFIQHLNAKTIAFYSFPLVGIVEEQTVAKSDPNYGKIKEELEQQKKPTPKSPNTWANPNKSWDTKEWPELKNPSVALSVEDLTKMAKDIKATRQDTHQSSSST